MKKKMQLLKSDSKETDKDFKDSEGHRERQPAAKGQGAKSPA
jgi:hypothetical protein